MLDRRGFVAMVAGAAGTLALGACGSGGKTEEAAATSSASGSDPVYGIEVTGAWLTGNSSGDTLLVVDYEMTNNQDFSRSSDAPSYSSFRASQSNRSLENTWISTKVPGYVESTELEPGETGAGQAVFKLASSSAPVVVSCIADSLDYTQELTLYKEELDPSELDVVTSEASFALTGFSAMVTSDSDGNDLLLVDFDYTNLSGEAATLGELAEFEVFQDGIELQGGYLPYNHPLAEDGLVENCAAAIASGKTLSCRKIYKLRDDAAPVSLCVVDWESFDQRTVVEKNIVVAEDADIAQDAEDAEGGDEE